MASITHHAAPNESGSDNDLDARCARIRRRLLDGIDQTLDELAQPEYQRAAIAHAVEMQVAALFCRQATCRRARRCRSEPCRVTASADRGRA